MATWTEPRQHSPSRPARQTAKSSAPAKPQSAAPRALKLTAPLEFDPLESWHQEQIFLLCELHKAQYPELADLYAVPNGGWRNKATAKALQKQGVRPGVPDMQLDHARGGWFGLRIELKRFRSGEVSDEQEARIKRLHDSGFRVVVCWGYRDAWDELRRYLSLPPTVSTRKPAAYDPFKLRPGSRAAIAAAKAADAAPTAAAEFTAAEALAQRSTPY